MLIKRVPWIRQPPDYNLSLNLSDAVARGMVGAWVPTPAGYIDASGYNNHCLTRVGTTANIIQPGPNGGLAGQFTTADAFTGGTATPDLSNVQGGFSVAVWVKFAASPTSYGGVFARAGTIGATDAGGDWALLHRSTSKRLVLARSGQELFDMFSNVSDGVWYLCHMSVPVSGTAYWWVSGGTYGPATQFNAATFNRIRTGAGAVGINGSVTGAATGNSAIGRAYLWNRATTKRDAEELYLNEWHRYAPRSIWVPVSVGAGGGTASITPADGIATTSTFAGTSTAAATLTAAAGAATASTITASAIAAASMTAATGAATTSTLTGSAATAAAMTAAAGAATTSTLTASSSAVAAITAAAGAATASTLTASASAEVTITAAAGAATANTMVGAATAVAAITQADGAATTSTLTGSGLTPGLAGISPATGVATTSTMAGTSTAAASLTAATGAATGETLAGTSTAAAAMTPATGTATGETMVSGSSAISAASMTPATGTTTAATFAASAVAASVCIAAAGAAAEQTMAASAMARAAISAAAGVATCRTLVDANAVDTNSAWWTYTIAPDNLTFAIPADDLSYAVGADQLAY